VQIRLVGFDGFLSLDAVGTAGSDGLEVIEKDDLSRRLADEPGNDGVMSRTTGS
jgi:hypothetical protein